MEEVDVTIAAPQAVHAQSRAGDVPADGVLPQVADRPGIRLLREAIRSRDAGPLAVVSSFGAESGVLLALVAEIDASVPVLFLDTGKHFAETLAYRRTLAAHLGLLDVRDIAPDAASLARGDPDGNLHRYIPDDCCDLRKTAPLAHALAPFRAWVNGRKRYQAPGRAALPFVEHEDGRAKFNPLADWTASDIAAEAVRRGLPAHPLTGLGYRSIGCAPCTRPASDAADPRSGRWAGHAKTECGIHRASPAHFE